jgi:hypothetical protein
MLCCDLFVVAKNVNMHTRKLRLKKAMYNWLQVNLVKYLPTRGESLTGLNSNGGTLAFPANIKLG